MYLHLIRFIKLSVNILDDLDLDEKYDELVKNEAIKKRTIDARRLLTHIAKMQFESGYPYMVFKSNANRAHALKEMGQIKMSNLCTEIFQLQETSTITDYGEEDIIARDISCNLGSLNIVMSWSGSPFVKVFILEWML